jgi:hypothetical protein
MGERKRSALRVEFDRELKLEFHGAKITTDAGLLLYRELDEAFGLTQLAEDLLHDTRTDMNTQHALTGLVRQSIYGRLAGYEDTNDADRLRIDPAMRRVVGDGAQYRPAASTSQMGRFETQMLAGDAGVAGGGHPLRQQAERVDFECQSQLPGSSFNSVARSVRSACSCWRRFSSPMRAAYFMTR